MGRAGVALVAGLLVLAAVGVLVAGSLFATSLDLHQARNALAHARASAVADAGLEVAIGLLRERHRALGRFPPMLDLPGSPSYAFELAAYRRDGDHEASVAVVAREGGAQVRREAVLIADPAVRVAARR